MEEIYTLQGKSFLQAAQPGIERLSHDPDEVGSFSNFNVKLFQRVRLLTVSSRTQGAEDPRLQYEYLVKTRKII